MILKRACYVSGLFFMVAPTGKLEASASRILFADSVKLEQAQI